MKFENLEAAGALWSEVAKIKEHISTLDDAISGEDIDFRVYSVHDDEQWLELDDVGLDDACAKAVKKVLVNRLKAIEKAVFVL